MYCTSREREKIGSKTCCRPSCDIEESDTGFSCNSCVPSLLLMRIFGTAVAAAAAERVPTPPPHHALSDTRDLSHTKLPFHVMSRERDHRPPLGTHPSPWLATILPQQKLALATPDSSGADAGGVGDREGNSNTNNADAAVDNIAADAAVESLAPDGEQLVSLKPGDHIGPYRLQVRAGYRRARACSCRKRVRSRV